MSITTWGWGCQGGLVTTWGWGGCAVLDPNAVVGIPARPCIIDSNELRPSLALSERAEELPTLTVGLELAPSLAAAGGSLRPILTAGAELRPSLAAEDEDLSPQIIGSDSLRPEMAGAADAEEAPQLIRGDELKPAIASTEDDEEEAQLDASEVKPTISDTDTGKC